MLLQREKFTPWIRNYLQKRYPELVPPLQRALEAFDRAESSGILPVDDLTTLTDASRDSRKPLSENIAYLLGYLARRFDSAREAIHQMSKDPKAHIRINALVALDRIGTCQARTSLVCAALRDRSTRVRGLAADKICGWNMTEAIPDLDRAIVNESNAALRRELEWQRDLLRDGYSLQARGDGRVWMTCRRDTGGTVSAFVTAEEINEKGVVAIAHRLGVDLTRGLSRD